MGRRTPERLRFFDNAGGQIAPGFGTSTGIHCEINSSDRKDKSAVIIAVNN